MLVIVLQRYDQSLAGKLSRWLVQVSAGVFVGNLSASVRAHVQKVLAEGVPGGAIWLESTHDEQGFRMTQHGNPTYSLEDFDGLQLISRPNRRAKGEK